jgi:hypothetical protein
MTPTQQSMMKVKVKDNENDKDGADNKANEISPVSVTIRSIECQQ